MQAQQVATNPQTGQSQQIVTGVAVGSGNAVILKMNELQQLSTVGKLQVWMTPIKYVLYTVMTRIIQPPFFPLSFRLLQKL